MKQLSKNRARVARIDERLCGLYGDPRPRTRSAPLDTLVRTILSQNTNDRNRDRAYRSLRRAFPTWEKTAGASAARIADAIRVGGLANQKARHIRSLLKWVKRSFGAFDLASLRSMKDEEIRELLEPLPGIGPKTLSILLVFALGREAFPVDTHCLRLLKRFAVLAPNTTAEKAHEIMEPLVAQGRSLPFHLNLIHFGRDRCHARSPRCLGCPLRRLCVYEGKDSR
ncbi:MAG: endonuclease III domain-containing protein [Planctomycetota bacterium]|jgi:endonuclease-3